MDAYALKTHLAKIRSREENYFRLNRLWRARGYWAAKDKEGPLRQAKAFASLLENLPHLSNPGELIVGSTQGALGTTIPSQEEYQRAETTVYEELNLPFLGHWDHACPDYETLLEIGVSGILERIQKRQTEPRTQRQYQYLQAMELSISAFQNWILSLASYYEKEGALEHSRRLKNIATSPPQTFWEALQLIWLIDLTLVLEERGAMAFGRMDQYLYPFYKQDLATGHITKEEALQLIAHFYAKLEEPLRPNPINNIALGGVRRDGTDGTNSLSYLFLEAARIVRSPHHNLTARWHKNTPHRFKRACYDLFATGIGFPSVVNDEILVKGLQVLGFDEAEARDYCFVGCIETYFPGKTAPWADSRFNLLKVLTETIEEQKTSPPPSFPAFLELYFQNLKAGLTKHAHGIKQEENYDYWQFSSPFFSSLIEDCIARGCDLNGGGAIYPAMHGIAGMGLATTVDSLAALKRAVYEEQVFSFAELAQMLAANFVDFPWEQQYLLKCPKYGNGRDEVDRLAGKVAAVFGETIFGFRTLQGGRMLPLLAANIANIEAGLEVGASPDGREAFTPLSDAASPHFGRDKRGPAAVIDSLAHVDYLNSIGGNVVNMKLALSPHTYEADRESFLALITTYFQRGGLQLQFNTTDKETLLKAQQDPESYSSLVVRVSGFSAYFVDLALEVQNDILQRTEHQL